MRSVIEIHWDERVDKDVAVALAESLADEVAEHIVGGALSFDSDVSATLWEPEPLG